MRISIKALLPVAVGLLTIVAFQNCGKVNFQPGDDMVITAKSGTSDETAGLPDNPDDISQISGTSDDGNDGHTCDHHSSNNSNDSHSKNGIESSNVDGAEYVCILDGPGNSVRLGIVSEALQAVGHTPTTLCMSQSACLQIANQKFVVKAAVKRGYCNGHNPNVIQISDEDFQAKINAL